jgi:histidinol-phosphate aminotransferase
MAGDALDLDALAAAVRADTRLVFVANPNNPTGTAFEAEAFDRFLGRIPAGVLVVLDEAYAEYGERLPDGPGLVRAGRELLVLRTFSKVYALAGLRVGYGLGPAGIVRRLSALTPPFGVGHAAQEAAVAALADQAHVRRAVSANVDGRRALTAGLRTLGLTPAPSAANFVYVDLHRAADPVRDAMLAAGVRVRSLAAWGAPTAIRITVGTPSDVAAALHTLSTTLTS